VSQNLVETLTKTVETFKKQRGLVIGDIILDEYLFGKVQRISPEAPVPIVTLEDRKVHLGGAANVAKNLRALGANVLLFGVTGDDNGGEEILELVEGEGLSGIGIVRDRSRKTTVKTRIVGRGQQMLRLDNEVTDPISDRVVNELLKRMKSVENSFDFIILEDYNKGVLTLNLIERVLSSFSNKLVSVDPKFENFFAYKGCDIFKPNLRELQAVTGTNSENEDFLLPLFLRVKERISCRWLVITRGEKGFVIIKEDGVVFVPAWRREVFDVTGAGDTVIAVLSLACQQGLDIVSSTILASLAAGIEVGKFGASTVSPEELLEAVEKDALDLENSLTFVPLEEIQKRRFEG
jgi:rfaE bifunctional protein kinase chain/domain